MRGGMVAREHRAAAACLSRHAGYGERVIVATGRYIGEGFDDARLDTLFLTMPLVEGHAHPVHRSHSPPASCQARRPHLRLRRRPGAGAHRMFAKRLRGYRSLGYELTEASGTR